jgi:glutathione S-transferase
VSLVYERLLHREKSEVWMKRCETQIAGVLDALEADRAGRKSAFWFGDAIGHADIAVASVIRFTREAHPGVFDVRRWPALAAQAERCEALPPFQEIAQPFSAPATEIGPGIYGANATSDLAGPSPISAAPRAPAGGT